MASAADLNAAAATLRRLVDATADLPDDGPADARLRDRLELAAAVLEAASGRCPG